jgi:hypothetical protein
MKLLHLVNPVKVAKSHELYTAQHITFASMLNAKNYLDIDNVEVVLASTQLQEDKDCIPEYIFQLSNLTRSVNQVNEKLSGRNLPLINDILTKANEIENVDYIIYTNVDIALMPFFYKAVYEYIMEGHDFIAINRRRLENKYTSVNELTKMYAEKGRNFT